MPTYRPDQQTFPQVEKFEDGTGWSFGRSGSMLLNDNINRSGCSTAEPRRVKVERRATRVLGELLFHVCE